MIGTELKTSRECIAGLFAKRTQFLEIIPEASGHRDAAGVGFITRTAAVPIVRVVGVRNLRFLTAGIDNLILHDTKNALHKIVGPLVGVYADVATLVVTGTGPA